MRQGHNHVNKLDFLEAYPRLKEGPSMYNMKNVFRATGSVPLNRKRYLGALLFNFAYTVCHQGAKPINKLRYQGVGQFESV